nr:TonB-dependent receptor [Pedobacter panaciterrae]
MNFKLKPGALWPGIRKIFLVMKLIAIFLLAALVQVQAKTYAQNITIQEENITIEKVLRLIEKQSKYQILYINDLEILKTKKININVDNVPLVQVLNRCLSGLPVSYAIVQQTIALKSIPILEPSAEKIDFKVSGTVTDTQGLPLPGVSVVVKGTDKGVATDPNGKYSINAADGNQVLVFTFVGYERKEVPINNTTRINVQLKELSTALDDVVVVGYGTQKKSDVTGAITSLKTEDFNKGAAASLNQLMAGKAAGVRIVQNSNEPGGGISVNIRGAGSVSAGTEPLYVVDGLPLDNTPPVTGAGRNYVASNTVRSPLNSINPADIASIEILKDASATAIYGSRGANGVIIITTKKGKEGKTNVNYSAYLGLQNVAKKLDVLNADEYMTVLNDIIANGGGSASEKVGGIQDGGTDWQDQIYKRNAQIQNHNLSISGGNTKSTFFVGLNYYDQQGVVITSGIKRYSARLNLTNEVSDKFNIGLNLSTSYTQDNLAPEGNGFNENGGTIYSALNMDPTISVRDPSTGLYQLSPYITIDNPLAIVYGKKASSAAYRTYGTFFANYKIIPDLEAKINIGGDILTQRRDVYVDRTTIAGQAASGAASVLNGTVSNYVAEGTLTYHKNFGVHQITALAGATTQRFITSRNSLEASGFPSDATGTDNVGSGTQSTYSVGSTKLANRLLSFLGRINYSLMNKYLFTASFRADGSSRFGANNRFGYFPSFSGAWKINEEEFMKNITSISNLKLKASWGRTGNQSIADYQSFETYSSGPLGVFNGQLISTQEPARLPNPDLKWETTEQTNFGFEIGLLNDRIAAGFDYYTKRTYDMLLNKPVTTTSGFTSQLTNIGSIRNTGLELTINSKNIDKTFKWNTSVNMATIRNKVIDLGGAREIIAGSAGVLGDQPAIIRPGEPLYSFYGYEVIGVWQTGDDFSKTTDAVHPGDLKYRDVNGDGTVNANDRVILGNSFPKFTWGLNNNFSYKRFSLDIQIEGVHGLKMFNNNLADVYFPVNFRRNKFAEPYLQRWTASNPSNVYPSFVTPLSQGQKIINSYTVQDASYIRLQTVTLSYSFPAVNKVFRSGTVYVTGQNLFTKTNYDGMDPAVNPNGNANYRVDFNSYPLSSTFLFGVNFDF